MDSLVKDASFASTLQDKFYTIRENRFVLPVAITNKNKVQGIVHGVSGTGSTVYIEPQQVIDLNMELGEQKSTMLRLAATRPRFMGTNAQLMAEVNKSATSYLKHSSFIEKLLEGQDVVAVTNSMSTQLSGEDEAVFAAIQHALRASHAQFGRQVLVAKFIPEHFADIGPVD